MTAAGFVQGVLVPLPVCLFLENNLPLTELRGRTRGDDPDVDKVLLDLRRAALACRADATSHATSAAHPAPSALMTPREAAARGAITPDAVRAAIRRNRLPATRTEDGWRIHPADFDAYLGSTA